jgi:hypothetical protein
MHTLEVTLSEAEARALKQRTGQRDLRQALVTLIGEASRAPVPPRTVLTEGRRHYRASSALLAAVAGYDRSKAIELNDRQLEKLIGFPL